MSVRAEQPVNTVLPIVVTLLGMVTLVSSVQLEKADSPILVTGDPPKVAGIVSAPLNPVGAVNPVIVASSPEIVYSSPVAVSVAAKTCPWLILIIPITIKKLNNTDRIEMDRVFFMIFTSGMAIFYSSLHYRYGQNKCQFFPSIWHVFLLGFKRTYDPSK